VVKVPARGDLDGHLELLVGLIVLAAALERRDLLERRARLVAGLHLGRVAARSAAAGRRSLERLAHRLEAGERPVHLARVEWLERGRADGVELGQVADDGARIRAMRVAVRLDAPALSPASSRTRPG